MSQTRAEIEEQMRETARLLDAMGTPASARAAWFLPLQAELAAADAREREAKWGLTVEAGHLTFQGVPLEATTYAAGGHVEAVRNWMSDDGREDWRAQLHSDGTLFVREDCSDVEAARHLVLTALDERQRLLARDEAGNLLLACTPGGAPMLLVTPAGEWDRLRPEAWAEGEPDETSRRVWTEVARLLVAVPRELLP